MFILKDMKIIRVAIVNQLVGMLSQHNDSRTSVTIRGQFCQQPADSAEYPPGSAYFKNSILEVAVV